MTNGINTSDASLQAYRPQQTPQAPPNAPADQASPPDATQDVKAGDLAARAASNGLATEEQRMVDRYFPESQKLSLRLYGPDSSARDVTPAALGSRLDVRG
jgi:hypothetical protein